MALKDLGKKGKNFYDCPAIVDEKKETIQYPEISLPLDLVKAMNLSTDDKVIVTIKGRVSGLEDTKYSQRVSIEAHKGEVVADGKLKSEKSILDEA